MAAVPTTAAAVPVLDHGERADKPTPVPNTKRIRDTAAVAKAPPITAAQDTPDEDDSCGPEESAYPDLSGGNNGALAGCDIQISSFAKLYPNNETSSPTFGVYLILRSPVC